MLEINGDHAFIQLETKLNAVHVGLLAPLKPYLIDSVLPLMELQMLSSHLKI
jgi:hypothetical protein